MVDLFLFYFSFLIKVFLIFYFNFPIFFILFSYFLDLLKEKQCDITHVQASDRKGKHFLDLLDDNFNTIKLSYTKGSPWLQVFGHSNSLCAHAMRAITNHAPIGEYQLIFFPNKDFLCPCNNYPIKSRRHILHECKRFNRYWNSRRDSLNHFIMFLIANPNAFTFTDL